MVWEGGEFLESKEPSTPIYNHMFQHNTAMKIRLLESTDEPRT